jgi:hypothetical protein
MDSLYNSYTFISNLMNKDYIHRNTVIVNFNSLLILDVRPIFLEFLLSHQKLVMTGVPFIEDFSLGVAVVQA